MSEEIKATQENTKETKKGFAELKQALIEQNKKDAQRAVADFRKQQIADKKSVEKINRQLKTELEQAQELKRISNNLQKANFATPEEKEAAAKRAQIAKEAVTQTIEERKILRVTRDTRKIQQDTRSDARKSLDLEKNSLSALQKQIEDAGGVAEDSLEFRRAQNRIRRQELAIRKSEATSPAARKEIRKEQRKERIEAFRLAIAPVSERLGGLVNIFKGIGSIGTGIPGLSLGRLAFLAAIPFIIKFLDSDAFKKIKDVIIPNAVIALNFLKNNILIPLGNLIKTGFRNAFQFIQDNQEEINAGLKVVGGIASFIGTNLVKGFKFMFGLLADLFFGREVEIKGGQFTVRSGKGLFGIIGGLIDGFKTGEIQDKFRNMLNKIKEFFGNIFSLESLANIYDKLRSLPGGGLLPEINPFREAIRRKVIKSKDIVPEGMAPEDVGVPGEKMSALDQSNIASRQLQDFLKIPLEQQRPTANFAVSRFISRNPNLFTDREKKILSDFTLSDAQKLEKLKKLVNFRTTENFADFPLEPPEPGLFTKIFTRQKQKTIEGIQTTANLAQTLSEIPETFQNAIQAIKNFELPETRTSVENFGGGFLPMPSLVSTNDLSTITNINNGGDQQLFLVDTDSFISGAISNVRN